MERREQIFFLREKDHFFILDPYSQIFLSLNDKLKIPEDILNKPLTYQQLKNTTFFENNQLLENFLSNIKILSNLDFFKDRNQKEEKYPELIFNGIKHVVINPSFECNLNCWYCYSIKQREKEKKIMNTKTIIEIIRIILQKKQEQKDIKPIAFSIFYTSEFSLRFKVFLRIRTFLEKNKGNYNFPIYLFSPSSNFIAISQSFVNFTNKYKYLTISHDITNFEQRNQILKNLKKIKKDVTTHIIIPFDSSIQDLFGVYSDFMKNFKLISLRPLRLFKDNIRDWTEENSEQFLHELDYLFEELLKMDYTQLNNFLNQIGPTDYIFRFIHKVWTREALRRRCNAGTEEIAIGPDLSIHPCSGLIGEPKTKLGHIDLQKKEMIFTNNINTFFSQRKRCNDCAIRYYCGGSCLDWNIKQEKEIDEICEIECKINVNILKKSMVFVYKLSKKFPSFLNEYLMKKGKKGRNNFPLDFCEFVEMFRL